MIVLSWKVKELDDLAEKGRRLHSDVKNLLNGKGHEAMFQVVFRPFNKKL